MNFACFVVSTLFQQLLILLLFSHSPLLLPLSHTHLMAHSFFFFNTVCLMDCDFALCCVQWVYLFSLSVFLSIMVYYYYRYCYCHFPLLVPIVVHLFVSFIRITIAHFMFHFSFAKCYHYHFAWFIASSSFFYCFIFIFNEIDNEFGVPSAEGSVKFYAKAIQSRSTIPANSKSMYVIENEKPSKDWTKENQKNMQIVVLPCS